MNYIIVLWSGHTIISYIEEIVNMNFDDQRTDFTIETTDVEKI
jgi:hypothetical protein